MFCRNMKLVLIFTEVVVSTDQCMHIEIPVRFYNLIQFCPKKNPTNFITDLWAALSGPMAAAAARLRPRLPGLRGRPLGSPGDRSGVLSVQIRDTCSSATGRGISLRVMVLK
jgi:hypothetical protein